MLASSADSDSNRRVPVRTTLKLKDAAVGVKCTISMNDLGKLKEQDTFLYYSIPEVHHAKMLEEDIDASSEVDPWPRSVTRRSCISFECHPDLLLAEDGLLGNDPEDDSGEEDGGDPLDIIMARMGIQMM